MSEFKPFEQWVNIDLQAGPRTVTVPNGFFTQDNMANKLGVRVFDNGVPHPLTGGIIYYAKLADGTTLEGTGADIDEEKGNEGYIVLPSEAYAVVGMLSVAIVNKDWNNKKVLAVFAGYVHETKTNSEVVPGQAVADLADLLNQYQAMVAATTAANNIVLVQETQPENATGNKIWVQPRPDEYQVPTWEEFQALDTTVDGLGESMTTAESDIDALEATTSDHGARLNTAEDDIDAVESTLSDLKSALYVNVPTNTSIWEQGTIIAATGDNTSSDNVIRTKGRIPIDFVDVHTLAGYEISVYGWSGSTYLGFYNGTTYKKTGSALSYYATQRLASDLITAGADSVRLTMRKTGGGVAVTPSEGINVVRMYSRISQSEIVETDLQTALNLGNSPYQHGVFDIKRCDFSGWYSGLNSSYAEFGESSKYADVITAFDALVTAYPDYISRNALGTASGTDESSNTYTIYEYVFKPKKKTSIYYSRKMPKIYMDGSIHGFEKNSTYGIYYFLKDVAEHWAQNPMLEALRSQVEIHVIPVSNPYGFDYNIYVNGNGVNINRNFAHPGEWTVVAEPPTEVNGAEAFDQPESAIIRDWLLAAEDDILMYFNCHTNGMITTGYDGMNICMTSNDRNDAYFNKLIGVFTNHIEKQTLRFPAMYPAIQPSSDEMCGTISTTATAISTKGTASSWADTMRKILAMTLESFNGLKESESVTIISKYSDDSKKINSEIIGNMVMQVIAEYAPY